MKLYVPYPQLWLDYFDRVSKGTSNQRGGGRRPRIIMVKPSLKKEKDLHVSINAVLRTEQTAARAKSELEREDINPKDVEKMFHKLSERRRDSTKKEREKGHLLPLYQNDRNAKEKGEVRGSESHPLKDIQTYLR